MTLFFKFMYYRYAKTLLHLRLLTCTQEFRILELKIESASLNSTTITSGYAGRDPQGGTSDKSFFSKFSFRLQRMVKVLLLVLVKKKREI